MFERKVQILALTNEAVSKIGVTYPKTRSPLDEECLQLCENLISISSLDSQHKSFFPTVKDNYMHSVAWAFSLWLQDYENFGIVPGICIDCKAVANRYGLSLIIINGRTNEGHIRTFFMGFIPNKTEKMLFGFSETFETLSLCAMSCGSKPMCCVYRSVSS